MNTFDEEFLELDNEVDALDSFSISKSIN